MTKKAQAILQSLKGLKFYDVYYKAPVPIQEVTFDKIEVVKWPHLRAIAYIGKKHYWPEEMPHTLEEAQRHLKIQQDYWKKHALPKP